MPLDVTQTITSDSTIQVGQTQTINSDTLIKKLDQTQTINADNFIKKVNVVQSIPSNSSIYLSFVQTITSNSVITINEVLLQLFKESDLSTEVGTATNLLDFGTLEAGLTTPHPDNPFVLFNDKGAAIGSVPAREVKASVVQMDFVDELTGSSNGTASQVFTVAFPPIVDDGLTIVKVNDVAWTRVTSFAGLAPTDEAYILNPTAGTITFGDGLQGKVPPLGNTIKVSYTPDTFLYGKEVTEQLWIGIKSNGVISNPVAVPLEQNTPSDLTHVTARNTPVVSVLGVFLLTDPFKVGTNFFTGGGFNASTGLINLGTPLPNTNDVWVDYTYTIGDDAEGGFTQIGKTVSHSFVNSIPSNNAKRLTLVVVIPAAASPSGLNTIRFKLRFEFKQ